MFKDNLFALKHFDNRTNSTYMNLIETNTFSEDMKTFVSSTNNSILNNLQPNCVR